MVTVKMIFSAACFGSFRPAPYTTTHFENGYLLFRVPALVGAHSLFMDFGDGLAPPIRI
jgi:hypothetical protein